MWTEKKSRRALRTLSAYARPHAYWLALGGLATVGVVLFRLAMPWPLRGVVEVAIPEGSGGEELLADYLPAWGDPVLWFGALYVLFALGCGVSEMIQRVNIMRFAAHTVHSLRADAVRGAALQSPANRTASGELIARVIGDSARVKAGLSGILVHVSQNGLLFAGVCGVLLYISSSLGLIFLAAGLMALYIGLRASIPVADNARKQRRKEGKYAVAIQEGLDHGGLDLEFENVNWSSARKEVRATKLIALSSLLVHVVLAATVGLGLWIGTVEVRAGLISPGELFLFIAYALTVHRRMVQVGRQVARSGKVLACADRIGALLELHAPRSSQDPRSANATSVPLDSGLRLEQVKLSSGGRGKVKPRLCRTDLVIHPGSRVVVLGDIGAGKSSLLRLLAGLELPSKGKVFWDEEEVSSRDGTLLSRVGYLSQDPVFPPAPIWKILHLPGAEVSLDEHERTLKRIGAWRLVRGLPRGLEERVSSQCLSRNESRVLSLAGILLGEQSSVWVLDSPLEGLERRKAGRRLDEILNKAAKRTVAIALSQPIGLGRFDRVLKVRRGQVCFDGTPAEWKERNATAGSSR